ncbi:MAG TPA: FAD binding domain-containing protein [Clostridia bacterium]|nr:FAD binding domain-containing protein [Clostridia bacterium]
MKEVQVSSPKSTAELVGTLASYEGKYMMLAGCTDLLVDLKKHLNGCGLMIDLSGIKEMRFIKVQDNDLVIGALTTFTEISESPLVREHGLCLAQAAGSVGSPQIRNRATIGGNIANGSPAADSIPALLVLNAWIKYTDRNGSSYKVGLEEYLGSHREQLQAKHGFIEAIGIPVNGAVCFSGFIKLGSRSNVTISKLSLAVTYSLDDKDTIQNPRLGLGSVGKTAVRAAAAEKLMEGRTPGKALIQELGSLLSAEIEEKLKGRASMPYKKKAIIGLVQDLFSE